MSSSGSGSDALPSHPRRDTDVDADVSLERKRPRLSDDEPQAATSPIASPVIEVIEDEPTPESQDPVIKVIEDEPTPESQDPVIITSGMGSTSDPSELLSFPLIDNNYPTAQAAAQSLADEIFGNLDVEYPELAQVATWFSNARVILETEPRHFEDSHFWLEVSRIIIGLVQRDSLRKSNKFPYEKMGPVLITLCQETAHVCALSMEYEATNIERGVSRRDSVRTENGKATEDALYKPMLAPCIEALNTVLQPKCDLYGELNRRGNLQRFATTTLASKAFCETSRELQVLTDLFDKYLANMTSIESPYNHIIRLAELSSHLLDILPPEQPVKLSSAALGRISAIFDETYFTVYQKMMSMQPRELPELHKSALDALQVMVHRLSRHHDGFAGRLFTKLVERASQRTSQSQSALEAEIVQTRLLCQSFTWECTQYLFQLDVALGLIRSGIRDHRNSGIALSNSTLMAAWEVTKRRMHDVNIGQVPLCQTLALCLLHLDFMGVIFGSDSHADVISQASNTVNFLLVTDRFTTVEMDKIWTKLSSSSQPDMTQACIGTLGQCTNFFTPNHISHVLGRLTESQTPPTVMWRVWITDAGKKVQNLCEHGGLEASMQLGIAEKLVTLLEHLFSFEVVENLDVIVRELLTFLNTVLSTSGQESTKRLIEYCVCRIGKGTRAATGPVQALNLLLFRISDTVAMCKEVPIFESALFELRAYISSRTSGEPQAAPWSGHELAPRVQLVLCALTTLNEADASPFEETIWRLVVGADAINSEARSVGLQAIVEWFHQRHSLSDFGHRCVEKFLPQLPAEHATPGLIDLHVLLEGGLHSPSSVILNSTLLEQLIRLSLASSDRDLPAHFQTRVCSWLFGKVAQQHHEEAQQAQAAVTQQCLRALASESIDTQLKALHLLKRLVCDGSAFEAATTTRCSVVKLGVFKVGDSNGEQDHLKVNIQALCSPEPSKQFSLLIAPATSVHELKAAILHHTGFPQLRAHSSGKVFDLDTPSSIQESGLTKDNTDCALVVQRAWSFEDVLSCDTFSQLDSAIQQTLLRDHSQLHALLDVGELAEQACMLLKHLPVPAASRVSAVELQSLPSENCWKAEYSVHVLQVLLSQQISHAIADAKFISQSIRLLVDVLVRTSERLTIPPLRTAVTALLSFLKERPVQDVSSEYFDNPQQFILSVMRILAQLAEANDWMQDGPIMTELAGQTFQCLLEATISCSRTETALLGDEAFKERFKSLLRSRNCAIASAIGQSLANTATCLTPELTTMFWSCTEDLLVDIADDENIARAAFEASVALLQCHKELLSDEASVRSLVDRIVDLLRKIQPEETFNSSCFDYRVRLLCVLLRFCVVQMKSFKRPLNLGQVALDLFTRLLFPKVSTDHAEPTRSVKHVQSREIVFDLISLLCDDRTTNALLVDASREFHHLAKEALDKDTSYYPGREKYLREERSHVGLRNLGQTCYLNSLLQQLFMNYDFRKFILEVNIPEDKQDPVLVQFKDLFSALHFSNVSSHAPNALAEILGIDVGVQEDAHLFFTMLISRLEDSMPDKETKEKLLSFFGGRNRSQTRGDCGHVSESTDDYLNLSLTVKDKINLTESLQEYVAGASLEGGDKFKCTTCEEEGKQPYVNAMRRTGLETIPNTLILGLKRFRYESWDGGTKVNDRFEFPAQLDMAPFKLENLANPSKSIPDNFELIGVIVHQGTLQMGHYWSYAKDHRTYGQQPGSWFRMEDAMVQPCDLDVILRECMGGEVRQKNGDYQERSDSAYILIYRRLAVNPAATGTEIVVPETRFINHSNSMLETKVHAFDDAHTQFIQQLLNQMDTFADLERQHESHAIELALMHSSRVTSTKVVTDKTGFQYTVEKTALRSIQNSKYTLCYVFWPENIERFLFGTYQLRMAVNRITHATLAYLRREDPCVYGQHPVDDGADQADSRGAADETARRPDHPDQSGPAGGTPRRASDGAHGPDLPGASGVAEAGLKPGGLVYSIIEAISRLLPTLQDHKTSWATCVDLVASIAGFGVGETEAVLDFRFLEWCLENITTRCRDDIPKNLRKAKGIWLALADAINRMLEHVDLSRSTHIKDLASMESLRREDPCVDGQHPMTGCMTRSVSDGKCSLNPVEIDLLLRQTDLEVGRSTLLRSICEELDCSREIKDLARWAPYRLIQTLMEADDQTVEFLIESMEFYLLRMPGDREGCIAVAIGICLSPATSLDAKNRILHAVNNSIREGRTVAYEALWFLEAITVSPDMMLMFWQALDRWFELLLRPSEDYIPEETFKWLCSNMLCPHVFTVPSCEASLAIDVARIEAAIRMHKWVRHACLRYMSQRTDISSMAPLFDTFHGVQQYLWRAFSILYRGAVDKRLRLKDIMPDPDAATDPRESSNVHADSRYPLVQQGGTISIPVEVEDMIGNCLALTNEGRAFKQQIESYKLEEEESDDEEDYEEEFDNDVYSSRLRPINTIFDRAAYRGSSPTIATASLPKKRKIVASDADESPPSSPIPSIPSHLQQETPSIGSPSEAYAALSLAQSHTSSMSDGQDEDMSRGRRSASPAKRSAAAMESGHESGTAQNAAEGNSPADTTMPDATSDTPSLEEQVKKVQQLLSTDLEEEEKGYIVSHTWLSRVLARVPEAAGGQEFPKEASKGDIGPVDNSDIVPAGAFDEPHLKFCGSDVAFIHIKQGLDRQEHYEIVPEEAWKAIVQWHGLKQAQLPIIRFAKNTAPEGAGSVNLTYEVYPPVFTIRKMLSKDTTGQNTPERAVPTEDTAAQTAVQIVASRQDRFQSFLAHSKRAAGIPIEHKVRPWRQLQPVQTQQPGMMTPATSRSASPSTTAALPGLTIDAAAFSKLQEGVDLEMLDVQDHTNNQRYDGRVILDTLGLIESQVLILEEQLRGPAGGEFASDAQRKARKNDATKLSTDNPSGRSTPSSTGPITRGRVAKSGGRARGTIGLTNLGNTCYMNSALQCVSRIEELATYFLASKYKPEINGNNPLGYGGRMAKAFGEFLNGLYHEGASSAYNPRQFKGALAQSQPMFSGYGQQDSQEFLSFLVDALHEDLNRIVKKPYMENPDSDDNKVHDPAYIRELGETYRSNHRARNDSIAMDLFNGFYKNTMVCPSCDKVSVTFDPYSLLTLQLPIENTWQHHVYYVPVEGQPTLHKVDLDKNASIKTFKQYFAKKLDGVSPDRLYLAEVFSGKIYKVFAENESVGEIQSADVIVFYELAVLATNIVKAQKRNTYRSVYNREEEPIPDMDSPMAESMAVTVHHRIVKSRQNDWEPEYIPLLVTITREEAKDYDAILRKVLKFVAKTTSMDILHGDITGSSRSDATSETQDDVEAANDTVCDASAVNDGPVSDRSVPSEDEYVNISKHDEKHKSDHNTASKTTSGETQDDLGPGSFIPPQLRGLFEMKYFKSNGDLQCGGQGQIYAHSMADRVRRHQSRRQSLASVESAQSSSSDVDTSTTGGDSREPSVDEDEMDRPELVIGDIRQGFSGDVQSDEELPTVEQAVSGGKHMRRQKFNKKNRHRGQKTYSKKDRRGSKHSIRSNQHAGVSSAIKIEEHEDNPYYIKLGEGITLDWNEEAWNALYLGNPLDTRELRGYQTLDKSFIQTTEDPELEARLTKRSRRRKEGVSLEDCFAETAKTETLSEENAWYCNRCKELRRADKTLAIWTLPDILVVHLKRFSGERYRRDKVDVLVDFPLEGLDLNERVGMKEDGKDCIYDLFAVDNHFGGLGGGHYTAFGKNFFDGHWYDFNDSMVSKISDPEVRVISPAAYLLFYRRRSSEPLGPQYLRELVQTARNAPDNASTASSDDELGSGEGTLGGPHSSRLLGSSSDGAKAGAGAGVRGAGNLHPRAPGGGDGSDAPSDQSPSARRSSEDEGLGMYDEDQPAYPSIVSAGAGWSFAGLNDKDDRVSDAGCSDEANLSSTAGTRRTTPIDNLFEDDSVEQQQHQSIGWEEE
ncbi:hypothetical protein MBLNU457_4137t1 [Dothideomycetes sp. NU457]